MERTGETFEEALEAVRRRGKDKEAIDAAADMQRALERRELIGDDPYPKPRSAKDFPSGGFETNRRRH